MRQVEADNRQAVQDSAQAEESAQQWRSAFGDKASLQDALAEWCADPASATATYGHISGWDVSAVTDMSYLFCGDKYNGYCRGDYNYGGQWQAKRSFNTDIIHW